LLTAGLNHCVDPIDDIVPRAAFRQLSVNFQTTFSQLSVNFQSTFSQDST